MELLVLIFATYVVTLVLTEGDGPGKVFARLRSLQAFVVLRCFLCTSIWIGAILALYVADNPLHWLVTALGLAGGAVFLDRLEV